MDFVCADGLHVGERARDVVLFRARGGHAEARLVVVFGREGGAPVGLGEGGEAGVGG